MAVRGGAVPGSGLWCDDECFWTSRLMAYAERLRDLELERILRFQSWDPGDSF